MRALVKHVAERALVATGVATAARYTRRGDVLILAYHNVLPDGERAVGDASLHLERREFVRQLDAIARTHDVVPLASALDAAASNARPRVVITFDDAYAGALSIALPELVRRGFPATVFVAPGLLGQQTWWDLLADPRMRAVVPELRDRLLRELQGDRDAIVRWAADKLYPDSLTESFRIGSEADVRSAAAMPGVSIGSHTWSHSNLAALDPTRVEHELRTSMEWLRARHTSFIPWLSYPYGLFTPDVEKIAARLSYTGSLKVAGGWCGTSRVAPHEVPRFNVPANLSIDGFRLRLSGLGAS